MAVGLGSNEDLFYATQALDVGSIVDPRHRRCLFCTPSSMYYKCQEGRGLSHAQHHSLEVLRVFRMLRCNVLLSAHNGIVRWNWRTREEFSNKMDSNRLVSCKCNR